MADFIQLEGSIKVGPVGGPLTEYGTAITSLKIMRTRSTVTVPATWGLAEESEVASSRKNMLQINFLSETTAASFWAELYDALDTDTGELDFEAKQVDASVGTDNRKFSGTFVVTGVETGGDASALRTQSQTFPIKRGTLASATS